MPSRTALTTVVLALLVACVSAEPHTLAGVQAAKHPTLLDTDAKFQAAAAKLMPIGAHTALLPEASDAGSNAALKTDGQSGDVDFPHGSMKPIVTIGEYDKTSGYMPVGVPDGMGVMLKNANEVRVIFQAESYGYISQGASYPMMVNDNAVGFTGSHIAYIDYDRTKMSTFLANTNSAESMVTGAGELIQYAYNLAGNKVGARDAADKTTVHYGDTNAAGDYVSADTGAGKNPGNLWTYHSFCSAHLEEAQQWGTNIGLVADTFLTVEEWTAVNSSIVQEKGYVGLSAHAVDIATKTAYAVGAFGMGGYEKIVEVNCGHTGYVCFSLSGYNGNFGANDALLARKRATGKRADNTEWAYSQDIVPARVYIGVKGYNADGTACGDACGWLAKNGLAHGKVYGFAAPTATADRDAWHKGNFRDGSGDKVTGFFASTVSWKWDGTVKDFTTDQAWEFQENPYIDGKKNDTHKFWTAKGRDASGSKTEHNSPDPRGASRFVQSSTAGYIGIYDFDGILTVLNGLAAGALPNSFAATYEIIEGESDISDRVILNGKGVRADGKLQTHMKDSSADKNTFEDVDGLEWIAAADGKNYLVIQEDGGNRYGERIFLSEIPPSGIKPKYMFIAQAGGAENSRIKAQVSVPAGTWSRATASEFSGVADLSGILKSSTGIGGKARRDADASVAIEDKYVSFGLQQHSQMGGVLADFRVDRGGQVLVWKPANIVPKALSDADAKAEVTAAVKLTGYTVETFKDAEKTAFMKGVAMIAGVAASNVKINSVTASAARRQLLAAGIEVNFTIKVKDATAATAASKSLNDVTPATMVAVFKSSGLTAVESVAVIDKASSPSPSPAPTAASPPPAVVASGAAGVKTLYTALVVLIAMIASLA